jgi:LPS-assembly protein
MTKLITKKELVYLLLVLASNGPWLAGTLHGATKGPKASEEFSDWIEEPASESLCKGTYLPPIPMNAHWDDHWELPVILAAGETEFTLQGQSTLRGNVTLKQGSRYLFADEITILRNNQTKQWQSLTAEGNIHYIAPGMSIWGEHAQYLHQEEHLSLENTAYRWYDRHARGVARHIDIESDEDTSLHLSNANYTTCAPYHNTWILSAKKISLYPTQGRARAKHVRLDLLHVPIFYLPYINYPIDNKRHSGFLFPTYGSTSNSGYEFTVPYYWNIAPNYDFTWAARWLTERGVDNQSKLRYLFAHSEGTLQWHFLPDDRKYGEFQAQNLLSTPGGLSPEDPRIQALEGSNNRHAINYRHTSQWSRRWQFNVIFDYVSDDNYLVDLGNDINTASAVDLPQQANLAYYGETWSHFFNVEEYQVLQPLSKPINEEIYKRQPQWVFQSTYPNQWLNSTVGLNGEMVNFAHRPDLITQAPLTIGQRYHLRPSLSVPVQESWYFFIPRAQLDWLRYELRLSEDAIEKDLPENPSRSIPIYDIDSGLIFERDFHFKKYSFVQTLEPRLYYLYVPYRDQHFYPDFDSGVMNFSYEQLFRDNRFSGRDRLGDANQISVSVMSRFLPIQGGQEVLRASIGQIFYFRNRRVSLCEELGQENACRFFEDVSSTSNHSNLIGQADIHLSPLWSGGLFWEWDSIHQDTEQAAVNVQYIPSNHKIINLNYYWLRHDLAQTNFLTGETGSLHQADASILWPLALHWHWLSLWRYDLKNRQTVEVLGGLEYSGCCIALQMVGSRYRQSNNFFYPQSYATGVFAQLVFKGLSSIGMNNPDGRLKQKIPGYVPLSDRQKWLAQPQRSYFPPHEIRPY